MVAASLGVVSSGELDGLVQALEACVVDVDALLARRAAEVDAVGRAGGDEGGAGFLGFLEGKLSGEVALAHDEQVCVVCFDGQQLGPGRVALFAPFVDGDWLVVVRIDDVGFHDVFYFVPFGGLGTGAGLEPASLAADACNALWSA